MENKIQKLYRNKNPKDILKVDDIKGACPSKKIRSMNKNYNEDDYKETIINTKRFQPENLDILIDKKNNMYDYYNNYDRYTKNRLNSIGDRFVTKQIKENNTRNHIFPESYNIIKSGDYRNELLNYRHNNQKYYEKVNKSLLDNNDNIINNNTYEFNRDRDIFYNINSIYNNDKVKLKKEDLNNFYNINSEKTKNNKIKNEDINNFYDINNNKLEVVTKPNITEIKTNNTNNYQYNKESNTNNRYDDINNNYTYNNNEMNNTFNQTKSKIVYKDKRQQVISDYDAIEKLLKEKNERKLANSTKFRHTNNIII